MAEDRPIKRVIADEPFRWTAAYLAQVSDDEAALRVKIRLKPQPGVPLGDMLKVRSETREAVEQQFNRQFIFVDLEGNQRALKVVPDFSDGPADLSVRLHPGPGRSNLTDWYVEAAPIVRAHEIGHALGFKDEYIDSNAKNRMDAHAAGVFADHSLMGNFFAEGIERASLKQRHADYLARVLSEEIGTRVSARAVFFGPPEPENKPVEQNSLPTHDVLLTLNPDQGLERVPVTISR
jgi:hypothetical protein